MGKQWYQRTSTQAPGGAPISKTISGSSQSQVQIQKTGINESTAIVPDTQDQTTKPKSDQSKIVIPDSDEESSYEHQTRLSRNSRLDVMSQIGHYVSGMVFKIILSLIG